MDIILQSKILEIVEVKKKTKAKMFANLKIGDKIQLSIPVESAGRNGGTYASYIKAQNMATEECSYNSFNQLPSILKNFEFKSFS